MTVLLVLCALVAGLAAGWFLRPVLKPSVVYRDVPVDRVVETRVEVPVDRIVEVPVIRFVDRVIQAAKTLVGRAPEVESAPPVKPEPLAFNAPTPNTWLLVLTGHDGKQSQRTMRESRPPETYIRPHGRQPPTKYLLISVQDHIAQYTEVA